MSRIQEQIAEMLDGGADIAEIKAWFNDALCRAALSRTKGNQSKAARNLRVHRNTFGRMLRYTDLPRNTVTWRKMPCASVLQPPRQHQGKSA